MPGDARGGDLVEMPSAGTGTGTGTGTGASVSAPDAGSTVSPQVAQQINQYAQTGDHAQQGGGGRQGGTASLDTNTTRISLPRQQSPAATPAVDHERHAAAETSTSAESSDSGFSFGLPEALVGAPSSPPVSSAPSAVGAGRPCGSRRSVRSAGGAVWSRPRRPAPPPPPRTRSSSAPTPRAYACSTVRCAASPPPSPGSPARSPPSTPPGSATATCTSSSPSPPGSPGPVAARSGPDLLAAVPDRRRAVRGCRHRRSLPGPRQPRDHGRVAPAAQPGVGAGHRLAERERVRPGRRIRLRGRRVGHQRVVGPHDHHPRRIRPGPHPARPQPAAPPRRHRGPRRDDGGRDPAAARCAGRGRPRLRTHRTHRARPAHPLGPAPRPPRRRTLRRRRRETRRTRRRRKPVGHRIPRRHRER